MADDRKCPTQALPYPSMSAAMNHVRTACSEICSTAASCWHGSRPHPTTSACNSTKAPSSRLSQVWIQSVPGVWGVAPSCGRREKKVVIVIRSLRLWHGHWPCHATDIAFSCSDIYICIYIYIERERERERSNGANPWGDSRGMRLLRGRGGAMVGVCMFITIGPMKKL